MGMIMFCKTCGTLLTPTLQPNNNPDQETETEDLRMICQHCNTSIQSESNTLSFTNYVHRDIPLTEQELHDVSQDPTLNIINTKNEDREECCKNREIVYMELPSPQQDNSLGVRYVCRGCLKDASI